MLLILWSLKHYYLIDRCFILNSDCFYFYFVLYKTQMHIDPFEEIEMAEKKAEEHRRSATEKDVRTAVPFLMPTLYPFNFSYE